MLTNLTAEMKSTVDRKYPLTIVFCLVKVLQISMHTVQKMTDRWQRIRKEANLGGASWHRKFLDEEILKPSLLDILGIGRLVIQCYRGAHRVKLRSSMSSVQSAAEGHVHQNQNSSAHVAHSGHLDAAAVLAHDSPQTLIGLWSRWTKLYELAIYGKKQLSFQLCYLCMEKIGRNS